MQEKVQLIGGIIAILAFLAGIIIKWARDRKDTEENKKSLQEVTSTLRKVSTDLLETKFDTKESNRLLTAVHRRMDTVEQEQRHQRDTQITHDAEIRFLKEEFKSLKDTQRFKLNQGQD